jgi:hypothetical protein
MGQSYFSRLEPRVIFYLKLSNYNDVATHKMTNEVGIIASQNKSDWRTISLFFVDCVSTTAA